MDQNWKKKINDIPKQTKGPSDKIKAEEWNKIVNVLSHQANNNTEGIASVKEDFKKTSEKILETNEKVNDIIK